MSKVQSLVEELRKLHGREATIETMILRIDLRNRPSYMKVGWFKNSELIMPDEEVSLLREFLKGEKLAVWSRIQNIETVLSELDDKVEHLGGNS